jgi:hypothetical protein
MIEGEEVTYVGPDTDQVHQGARGQLLAYASHDVAHVLWDTSKTASLVEVEDLTPARPITATVLDDSLEVGGLSTFAVRATFDAQGEYGVLNAMAQLGHLGAFGVIAEEALAVVASRIRQDPSFREVLSHLDEEEGESVLRLASACLIRDAFGEQVEG